MERCYEICEETGLPYEVHQVKEKFAGLRFYVSFAPEGNSQKKARETEALNLIGEVESVSFRVCEKCGNLGKVCSNGHWMKTLCPDHYEIDRWGVTIIYAPLEDKDNELP